MNEAIENKIVKTEKTNKKLSSIFAQKISILTRPKSQELLVVLGASLVPGCQGETLPRSLQKVTQMTKMMKN